MQTLSRRLLELVSLDTGSLVQDSFELDDHVLDVDQVLELAEPLDDFDSLGIGAVTVDDIAGLEFIDRFRRQMPEVSEVYSFQGHIQEYFSLEHEA